MFSHMVLDRIADAEFAKSGKKRDPAKERPLRSHTWLMRDGELIAKLNRFGIEMDRERLEKLSREHLSAESAVRPFYRFAENLPRSERMEEDWIWIVFTELWKRWFPDNPSFEMLDDKIQEGYELRKLGRKLGPAAACRVWWEAWNDALLIARKAGVRSIPEFDKLFKGTQSVFNWVQDFQDELRPAGVDDRRFLQYLRAVCESEILAPSDRLTIGNRRRDLAQAYFELGDVAKADALFTEWLAADPKWGWGWIGWSDTYAWSKTQAWNLERAEEILRKGLAVDGVLEANEIGLRLASVLENQGRDADAAATRKWAEGLPGSRDDGEEEEQVPATPIAVNKVGRNDPCPCGSGKKYKKCCGGR